MGEGQVSDRDWTSKLLSLHKELWEGNFRVLEQKFGLLLNLAAESSQGAVLLSSGLISLKLHGTTLEIYFWSSPKIPSGFVDLW